MIFYAASNAAYRVSLYGSEAELEGQHYSTATLAAIL